MADSITRYFAEEQVQDLLSELKSLGLNMTYDGPEQQEIKEDTPLSGKTVVLTGKWKHSPGRKQKNWFSSTAEV